MANTTFILLSAFLSGSSADEVDEYVIAAMSRQHIPGLSLAVMRNGTWIKTGSYGLASMELDIPAKQETVYELASAAKPIVAAGIMGLVQEGKLRLDDSIARFIEGAPEPWKEVTLRHLLSHTSGIKDYLERPEMTPFDVPPEKIAHIAATYPLNFAPGEKWAYSNTGYVLLGIVIEKVSGKSIGEFLEERVFKPHGMTSTRQNEPDSVVPNRATGYLWLGPGGFRNAEMFKYMSSNRGDAGILSTSRDLAGWTAALASDRLLTPENRTASWTRTRLNDGTACQYGLGWFIGKVNGHEHIYHPGGSAGAATITSIYPDDGLIVINWSDY